MKKINIFLVVLSVAVLMYGFVNSKSEEIISVEPQSADVIGVNIGNTAPELNYNSPNGDSIALSSLRGKIVLVDFWASWCPPCRRENPNIVATYNKFKDIKFHKKAKGFTVYSVSLDKTQPRWVNAIAKDGLIWKNHVSDLKGWASEGAEKYGVNTIPSAFLLNEEGVVIAKGNMLRGTGLEAELNKQMEGPSK